MASSPCASSRLIIIPSPHVSDTGSQPSQVQQVQGRQEVRRKIDDAGYLERKVQVLRYEYLFKVINSPRATSNKHSNKRGGGGFCCLFSCAQVLPFRPHSSKPSVSLCH